MLSPFYFNILLFSVLSLSMVCYQFFIPAVSGITGTGKKKILLLKGKEKEISLVSLAFLFSSLVSDLIGV